MDLSRGEAVILAEVTAATGFLSNRHLAEKTGYCRRQVQRILHSLEAKNLIASTVKTGGRGHTNQYRHVAVADVTLSAEQSTEHVTLSPLKGDILSPFPQSNPPSMSPFPSDVAPVAFHPDATKGDEGVNWEALEWLASLDLQLKDDTMSPISESELAGMSSFERCSPEEEARRRQMSANRRAAEARKHAAQVAARAAFQAKWGHLGPDDHLPSRAERGLPDASNPPSMSPFGGASFPARTRTRGDQDHLQEDLTLTSTAEGTEIVSITNDLPGDGYGVVAGTDHAHAHTRETAPSAPTEELFDHVPVRWLDKFAASAGLTSYTRREVAAIYNVVGWTLRDYGFKPSDVAAKVRQQFDAKHPHPQYPFNAKNLWHWLRIEARDVMRQYEPVVDQTTRPLAVAKKYRKQLFEIENEARRTQAATA